MLFELQYDLIPLLFTVSVLFTFIELYVCLQVSNRFLNQHYLNQDFQAFTLLTSSKHPVIEQSKSKQGWITRTVKRKEAPEDDADYIHNSAISYYSKTEEDINGSKICIHYAKKIESYFNTNYSNYINRVSSCCY